MSLLSTSFQKEEVFVDVPFSSEEAVHKMKLEKSAGPDKLSAEHLKHGGHNIVPCLTEILNSIVYTEQVPPSHKSGITIPIHKGGGNDPLDTNSYRGIPLNSVISEVLESLILDWLEPLTEAGVPHPNQTTYRK